MKTINLLAKENKPICILHNNKKTNYIVFKNILDDIYKLSFNYNQIGINDKNISISNNEVTLNIKDYKNNKNKELEKVINKLRKDFKELKNKKLRKQRIKRVSAFSCAILISSGVIAHILSENKNTKAYENVQPEFTVSMMEEEQDKTKLIEEQKEKLNFIKEEIKHQKSNIIETKEQNKEHTTNTKEEEKSENKTNNLSISNENITNTNEFEISFESRVDTPKYLTTKAYYNEIITNISNEYGIDPRIMLAIATQECGIHNPDLRGPAIGLMQIERAVWVGHSVTAYNYKKGCNETLNITENNLKDLDFNIRTSCMILRDYLRKANYNLPAAIQMYNFGPGNMNATFKLAYGNNMNFKEMCNSFDNSWLDYRDNIREGDSKYLERIFSYLEDLEDLKIKKGEETITCTIKNRTKKL